MVKKIADLMREATAHFDFSKFPKSEDYASADELKAAIDNYILESTAAYLYANGVTAPTNKRLNYEEAKNIADKEAVYVKLNNGCDNFIPAIILRDEATEQYVVIWCQSFAEPLENINKTFKLYTRYYAE